MTRIGDVPEINVVKDALNGLKAQGLVQEWEIPYENLLTRLTAAILFLTPASASALPAIWKELEVYNMLQYRLNEEKKLSQLEWRVEFNKDFQL